MPIGLLNNQVINDLRKSLLLRNLNPTTEATLGGLSSLNSDRATLAETSLPQGEYIPLNQNSVVTLGYYPLKEMSLKNRYAPSVHTQIEIADNFALAGNIGTYEQYVRTNTNADFDLKQFVLNSPTLNGYEDTPLGVIGAQQLKTSIEANIAQNTIKNTLGRINLNLFSLLNGEEFLIRDYQISELPNTGLGFLANLAQKYSGFEIPKSYLPSGSFGFFDSLFDGKVKYDDCTLEGLSDDGRMGIEGTKVRNNSLLRFTGRGQRVQLFNLLGINKYRPNYDDPNGSDSGLNRIFGFLQQQSGNTDAMYFTLEKTRRATGTIPIMYTMGIGDGPKDESNGALRKNDPRSILQENGLPKIVWDKKDSDNPPSFKRYMFSIENLAWIGYTEGLPICEIGNGDRDSVDKRPGRIMWFPPYDLSFDESVTVNWDKTSFIGRGEQVFTYNNTTRSGTIKFKVVVDHPSVINELRKVWNQDVDYKKFFKGCNKGDINYIIDQKLLKRQTGEMSQETISTIETKIEQETSSQFKKVWVTVNQPGGTDSFSVKMFFPNASSDYANYETTTSTTGATAVDSNLNIPAQNYINNTNFQLNSTSFDNSAGYASPETTSKLNELNTNAKDIEKIKITITVSSTNIGGSKINDTLSQNRFDAAYNWVLGQLSSVPKDKIEATEKMPVIANIKSSTDRSSALEKEGRYALIELEVKKKDLESQSGTTEETKIIDDYLVQNSETTFISKLYEPVYKECDYFYYLEKNDPLIFDKFRDKIKYFHPGFHSTTPEGLNSRLTFLHQCTRQGPALHENIKKSNGSAVATSSNLAFGRPPICILRIGDFFHTKMVIESMTIQYDEGVLWDLNPEGIGVQPRIASVNLSVSYLGGHSLSTPIRELQNALGFNFYANTETFQHRPILQDYSVTKTSTSIREKKIAEKPNVNSYTLNYLNSNFGTETNQNNVQVPFREGFTSPPMSTPIINPGGTQVFGVTPAAGASFTDTFSTGSFLNPR